MAVSPCITRLWRKRLLNNSVCSINTLIEGLVAAGALKLPDQYKHSPLLTEGPGPPPFSAKSYRLVSGLSRARPETCTGKVEKNPSYKRALCSARCSKFSSCLSWLVLEGKNDRHRHPYDGHHHHSHKDKYRLDLLKQKVPGPYSQPGKRQKGQETQSFFSFWIPHGLNTVILATNLRILIS